MKDNNSLKRDALIAAAAVVVMFTLAFTLNWISAGSDLGLQKDEMLAEARGLAAEGNVEAATALTAEAEKLPSAFSEAVKRTAGRMVGIAELGNLLAVVAVGAFFGFLVMKWGFPQTIGKIGKEFNDGWQAMTNVETTRWKITVFLVVFFAIVAGRSQAAGKLALPISDRAIDTIVHYEVGGRAYYEARLKRPTVPAWRTTASGVTVGFGVDCGHMSKTQINDAFKGILTRTEIRALQSVAGMKGRNAYYNGLPKVRHVVTVSWDQAKKVFERNTLPRFTRLTANTYNIKPGRLHPHENGALLCMTFNRGTKLGTSKYDRPPGYYRRDRYMEKRKIKFDLARGYAGYVPGHFRSMKRLWSYSKLKGLHLRYNATADLFALGSRTRLASR